MKTDLFQSCGHCWVFQICWHVECSTFTASSSRIWNSSTGTPSPPLALFVVMLPKAHLTSHSRISGSRSVITQWWLSWSWRSFLYSSSVKDSDAGKDWGQEEKGTTEDEIAGWHHWLNGRESQWTPGVGDGQGGFVLRFMGSQRVRHDWATHLIYGRKWRRTKVPLDESVRGEWKSWLKAQHSEN